MGIPKFARLLCERYPSLVSYPLTPFYSQIPEFDNLYLDMNGIIHNCTHDNNAEVSIARPEYEVVKSIFAYIEMLFRVVRPKKLFFMAVDGVAPRAKINQQRARRFMSAKNAEMALAKLNQYGTVLPSWIGYMYFVCMKMNTDPLWKAIKVIYSGHDVRYSGEGEHKIMSYIRYIRAKKDYNSATRHCLYGLDADLIILGLVCHEPYFSLLREEVAYRPKRKLPIRYFVEDYPNLFDLESLIDDWVFMVCLLGNDFLPHLPNLHTHQNVLPHLCAAYMSVFGKMQGYVNEAGRLNLPRLAILFEKLSEMDRDNFILVCEDFVHLTGSDEILVKQTYLAICVFKSGIHDQVVDSSTEASPYEFWSGKTRKDDSDISEDYASEWNDEMDNAFFKYRVNYYAEKLDVEQVDRGLQWNLYYYYESVASWEWFYPYHYSPFITDLKGFEDVNLQFVKGASLLPFCQQMAVLPPASRHLSHTFGNRFICFPGPHDFETDLNGKRNDWEAVIKLPFIDLELLNSVMASRENSLTAEEQRRNKPGCCFLYTYDRNMQGQDVVSSDPDLLPTVKNCKEFIIATLLAFESSIFLFVNVKRFRM
ncbi:5' 3' exoribonuclease 1 [Trichuris trichiura]|uniref:5' 3' exoribonuclease 1 n=1 Tax=Trichuris trichiura TaxID=36087 RepID=A0A077ZGF5_TRITR|nr:5' 3' exoribonuclease 1 [Trichuris trichiura]